MSWREIKCPSIYIEVAIRVGRGVSYVNSLPNLITACGMLAG